MSCVEWRTGTSVLAWCRKTLVVAGAVAAPGCVDWVGGGDSPVVAGPVVVPMHAKGAELDRHECDQYCFKSYGSTGTCHLATLAGVPAPMSGSQVIVCETSGSGHWETKSLSPFMQFGRRLREPIRDELAPATSAREHFERAAFDEAIAVSAFEQLVVDLEELAAPTHLIRAAQRAAVDEARHVRWTLALARGFEGSARWTMPRLRRPSRRKLTAFDLAVENATIGCVGETLGTWLQVFQARAAQHRSVNTTARRIAKDEARHAALAFCLFDWLDGRLDPIERDGVRAAMQAEAQRLDYRSTLPREIATQLGLPDAGQLARVALTLARGLALVCA